MSWVEQCPIREGMVMMFRSNAKVDCILPVIHEVMGEDEVQSGQTTNLSVKEKLVAPLVKQHDNKENQPPATHQDIWDQIPSGNCSSFVRRYKMRT